MNDTLSIPWVAWAVLFPLASAILSFLLGQKRVLWGSVPGVFGTFLSVLMLSRQVWQQGPQRYAIGGWRAPLGIEWHVDGLSILMLLMTAVSGIFISIYALGYYSRQSRGQKHSNNLFWPLWLFLWAALNGLFLSADLFNLYVTLELAGIAAVALVTLTGGQVALSAGLRYLLAALVGAMSYLLGVALLYASFGVLDIRMLGTLAAPGPAVFISATLMTLGLLIKTALFPLHFWLPPAHANAPAPVSAMLSGLVVKGSFYLVMRLWFEVFPSALRPIGGQFLGVLAGAAILWGSIMALRQESLKMTIAYSTVAQIGYLFLFFPLASPRPFIPEGEASGPGIYAFWGCVYQALSHALAKAAMFMASGNIVRLLGHDCIGRMDGVYQRLPLTLFAFGLSGVSLMGLPPSGGFVAKWLLLKAALEKEQWGLVLVIVAGGLLASAYVFRVLKHALAQSSQNNLLERVPPTLEIPTLILAALSLLLGFTARPLLSLLPRGLAF
jgi:formate hydrogenlyase subunit 3/multisubunit Na+/H+ antiporter MnhD subunit